MKREQERNGKMYTSDYFTGEHMSLEVLKKMKSLRRIPYLFEDMPPYPKVEFQIAKISHVTYKSKLEGIMESSGFKGGTGTDLIYWSLHVEQSDIEAAENQYLDKEFPYPRGKATRKRKRQDPFLLKFTTSPAFQQGSRFGNYKFTFPIKRLLELYQEQFCGGKQPVMRIYETEIFKQMIMYTMVVHSPECMTFDEYPFLDADDFQAVCVYQSDEGKVVWRAQAICDNHDCAMIIDYENEIVDTQPNTGRKYYVWDCVALVFHLPDGKVLEVEYTELFTSLVAFDQGDLSICNTANGILQAFNERFVLGGVIEMTIQ